MVMLSILNGRVVGGGSEGEVGHPMNIVQTKTNHDVLVQRSGTGSWWSAFQMDKMTPMTQR